MVLVERMAQLVQLFLAVLTTRLESKPVLLRGHGIVWPTATAGTLIITPGNSLNLPTVSSLLKGFSYYFLPLRTFVHRTHPVR